MKKILVLTFFIAGFFAHQSYSQIDLGAIMKGSSADATYIADGYLKPFMNSVSSGLNQGWYNTAANHKPLGFDLTFSVSGIFYPTSDQFYKIDNNKLTTLKITYPADGTAPTLFGPNNQTTNPVYGYKSGIPATPIAGPPGLDPKGTWGVNAIPLPIANLGIGLPKNTDLKLRFIPQIGSKSTNLSMFGIGVLHDIKQWIPGIKMVPIDLSVLVGYTSFKTSVGFDSAKPDQVGESQFTSTTIQALIGKKFSVVTLYGSVGYNFSNGTYKVKGSYPSGITGVPPLIDPVSIASSVSGARATGGIRLKFAVFTLHADYTLQKYNTLTVGFGIAVR